MEIFIILVIMAVASVMVYMQLKGTKPEVVPVMDLPRKKKSPKAAVVEKKVVENWDAPEAKSASPSPDGKKKSKKRFDPVAAGVEMVSQKKVEESTLRERKVVDESDARKEEKKARKQGFVVVEEKKVTAKRAAPVEPVVEEEPANETVARLRAILAGNKPAFDDSRPREPRERKEPKPEGPLDHEAIRKRLEEQEREKNKKLEAGKVANAKGIAKVSMSGAAPLAPWAKKVTKQEAPPAEEEAAAEPETAEPEVADEE